MRHSSYDQTKKYESIKFCFSAIINTSVSEFIETHSSVLRSVVEFKGCVRQVYLSVKPMVRKIKIIVNENLKKENR